MSDFQKFVDHVMSDDDSELGRTKAELAYALHCLEREISICHHTDAALLRHLQGENGCERTGKYCRDWQKCGCYLEKESLIKDEGLPTAADVRAFSRTLRQSVRAKMFSVGHNVVCVDDDTYSPLAGTLSPAMKRKVEVAKGQIYIVRWIGPYHMKYAGKPWGDPFLGVRVEGIIRSHIDTPFHHGRFRPVVERKTDIGFAHEILRKASKKAPALAFSSGERNSK
jgi:hypothetical protein